MEASRDPLGEAARGLFGVSYLYPVQRYVISNTLEGKDQVVVLPTGAGKSLCFQLPALLLEGLTVVLVPILTLLSDQVRRLGERGICVGVLRGGQTAAERSSLRDQIRGGRMRIVYATPEVLLTRGAAALLEGVRVACLVVDEAHCVCEWGETFRPAYLRLSEIVRFLRPRSITACTATASERILSRIRGAVFTDREVLSYVASPDRPNLRYRVVPALCKEHAVESILRSAARPAVLFARSRKTVERYARLLRRRLGESEVRFYHAGLEAGERSAVERWFLPSRVGLLCATCAYGMGVDKPDIRTAIHVDVPPSVEAYLQESGRAGRDGGPVEAPLVWSPEDTRFRGTLESPLERERYDAMLGYAASTDTCRRVRLYGLLGATVEHCEGCDVCAGAAVTVGEGAREIVEAIRRNPRRFDLAGAARLLAGERGYWCVRLGLSRYRGWGGLGAWCADDVETALGEMVRQGHLTAIRRGPWKGKLVAAASRGQPMARPSEAL